MFSPANQPRHVAPVHGAREAGAQLPPASGANVADRDPRASAIEKLQEQALSSETSIRDRAAGTARDLKTHMRETEQASSGVSGWFTAWSGSLDAMDQQGNSLARLHASQLQTAHALHTARTESQTLMESALLLEEEGRGLELQAAVFRKGGDMKNATLSLNAAQEKYNQAQLSFQEAEEGLLTSLNAQGGATRQFARDSRESRETFAAADSYLEKHEQRLRLARDGAVIAGATVATGGLAAAGAGFTVAVGGGIAAGTSIGGLANTTEAAGHIARGNKSAADALGDAAKQTWQDAETSTVTALSSVTGVGAGKIAGKALSISGQTLKGGATIGAISGGTGAGVGSAIGGAQRYAQALNDFNALAEHIPEAEREAVWQKFAAARGVDGAHLARDIALDTVQGMAGGLIGGTGGAFKHGQSQVRQLAVSAVEATADGTAGVAGAYGRAALDGRQFTETDALSLIGQTVQSSVIGELTSRASRVQISETVAPPQPRSVPEAPRSVPETPRSAPETPRSAPDPMEPPPYVRPRYEDLPRRQYPEQTLTPAEQAVRQDVQARLQYYGRALGEDFSGYRVHVSSELNGPMAISTRADARGMSYTEAESPVLHVNPNEIQRRGLGQNHIDAILSHEIGHEIIAARVPEFYDRLQEIGADTRDVAAKLFPENTLGLTDMLLEAAADGAGYAIARGHGFPGEQDPSTWHRLRRMEAAALDAAPLLREHGDAGSHGYRIATRARMAVSLDRIAEATEGPGHDPRPLAEAVGADLSVVRGEGSGLTPSEAQRLVAAMNAAFEFGVNSVRPALPAQAAQGCRSLVGRPATYSDASGNIDPEFRRYYQVAEYNEFSDTFRLRENISRREITVSRSDLVAQNPYFQRIAVDGETAGTPPPVGRASTIRPGDVMSIAPREGAEPQLFSVVDRNGSDDYVVRGLGGDFSDQTFIVSGTRLRDNQNTGLLNTYNQVQRVLTAPFELASDLFTMARTGFQLRPMEINGRKAWVLHPGHSFSDDPRQTPESNRFGTENKWYRAFEALAAEYSGRGQTLRVVSAEDLNGDLPSVHVGRSDDRPELNNYLLDHHRIRAARDLGVPIEVRISRFESYN